VDFSCAQEAASLERSAGQIQQTPDRAPRPLPALTAHRRIVRGLLWLPLSKAINLPARVQRTVSADYIFPNESRKSIDGNARQSPDCRPLVPAESCYHIDVAAVGRGLDGKKTGKG
jgi:hypothetical protein